MFFTALLATVTLSLRVATGSLLRSAQITGNTLARRKDATFITRPGVKFTNASALTNAAVVLSLKSTSGTSVGSTVLRNALASGTSTSINAAESGAGYAIDIDFGAETFSVIFDTGSSDLWLAQEGLRCVDYYGHEEEISECAFGSLYSGEIDEIAEENFNITYGDGEFLTGNLGYQTVCVGGLAVERQEVALVDLAYWNGDNESSGLMGFAYPALTSAYEGTDPTQDNVNTTDLSYTNWVFTAIEQGLMAPVFSVAISRGIDSGPSGQLALGGLPDVAHEDDWASTPLQILELTPHNTEQSNYSYYTIIPDGFLLKSNSTSQASFHTWKAGYQEHRTVSSTVTTTFPVIIDTGTTLIYLPVELAEEINAAFDPPAVYIEAEGIYEAACNAVPPYLAVVINGKAFGIDTQDLLLTNLGVDGSTGGCITGVQPIEDLYILGDSFLKNVIAVFDVGSSEMRFASRGKY